MDTFPTKKWKFFATQVCGPIIMSVKSLCTGQWQKLILVHFEWLGRRVFDSNQQVGLKSDWAGLEICFYCKPWSAGLKLNGFRSARCELEYVGPKKLAHSQLSSIKNNIPTAVPNSVVQLAPHHLPPEIAIWWMFIKNIENLKLYT